MKATSEELAIFVSVVESGSYYTRHFSYTPLYG